VAGGRGLVVHGLRAGAGRLDGARGQHAEDLALKGRFHAEAAKREATARGRLIPAGIPRHEPGVGDLQAAATAATPEEPGGQARACAGGALGHEAVHLRVVGQELEVPFVGLPGNIASVMVGQQHQPRLARAAVAAGFVRGAVANVGTGGSSAEGIGPGVDGIVEHTQDGVVDRQPPGDPLAPQGVGHERRQRQPFLSEPEQDLPGAAERGEFLKHQVDRRLDSLVGMFLDAAIGGVHVPDRQREAQLPASGFGQQSLVGALPQPAELGLADRALQAQEQAVGEEAGIVAAVSRR
jgi:hypothetical protein